MIPYHPNPKFSVRPHNFRRVRDHPLWDECVYAGLGQLAGSKRFFDSSKFAFHGDLVNTKDDVWGLWKGRPTLDLSQSNDYVDINCSVLDITELSFCCWRDFLDSPNVRLLATDGSRADGYTMLCDGITYVQTPSIYHSDSVPARNEWQHMGFRVSVDPAVRLLEAFGDGVPSGTATSVGTSLNTITRINFGQYLTGSQQYPGKIADCWIWRRWITDREIALLNDSADLMLDGAIEPIPTTTYLLPIGEAPLPTLVTDIFQSAIIGD